MTAILKDARLLASYLESKDIHSFSYHSVRSYTHIGALFTDIILQAGLNYNAVVRPRVARVMKLFPDAMTVDKVNEAIEAYGIQHFLDWKDQIKTERFTNLLRFVMQNEINNIDELQMFLLVEENSNNLLKLNGIGPKTLDYTLKLLGTECVAVDRHIYSYVKQAGVNRSDYHEVKQVVEFAADLLNVSRSGVDKFIWLSMNRAPSCQVRMDF